MMPDEIKPALTAEQWAEVVAAPRGVVVPMLFPDGSRDIDFADIPSHSRHFLAALCLHGQPFGFTREMVKALEAVLQYAEQYAQEDWKYPNKESGDIALARATLDRIAALLPPEGK